MSEKKAARFLTLLIVVALLVCCLPLSVCAAEGMYSYNGIVLPVLPEYDAESYPYVLLYCYEPSMVYGLFISQQPGFSTDEYWANIKGNIIMYTCSSPYTEWSGGSVTEQSPESSRSWKEPNVFVWSNYDLYHKDGTLVYAGSGDGEAESGEVESIDVSHVPDTVTAGLYIGINPIVSGTGDFDPACTCSIAGGTSEATRLTESIPGELWLLDVGADETVDRIVVTLRSVQNPEVYEEHTVEVIRADDPGGDTEPEDTTPDVSEPAATEPAETEPGADTERDEMESEGDGFADDLAGAIPDYSEGFMDALRGFASSMVYSGTDAVLMIPAIDFPEIGGLVPAFRLLDENELDFGRVFQIVPVKVMTLVQALFTIALIVYCFKELYGAISYVLTLRGGGA